MRLQINSDKAPKAVGPFSQAIQTNGLLFISGQLPIDVSTGEMVDTIDDQTHMCFKNLINICEEAGVSLHDAAKVEVLLDDINDFKIVNEIYAEYFIKPYPARVAFEVANLPLGSKIEIAATIVVDNK